MLWLILMEDDKTDKLIEIKQAIIDKKKLKHNDEDLFSSQDLKEETFDKRASLEKAKIL